MAPLWTPWVATAVVAAPCVATAACRQRPAAVAAARWGSDRPQWPEGGREGHQTLAHAIATPLGTGGSPAPASLLPVPGHRRPPTAKPPTAERKCGCPEAAKPFPATTPFSAHAAARSPRRPCMPSRRRLLPWAWHRRQRSMPDHLRLGRSFPTATCNCDHRCQGPASTPHCPSGPC